MPLNFKASDADSYHFGKNELLDICLSFKPINGIRDEEARRIYYYAPKIILASDWVNVEDFNIVEWAETHHQAISEEKNSSNKSFTLYQAPWLIFPRILLKKYPDRVSFSAKDLDEYFSWSALKCPGSVSYREYREAGNNPVILEKIHSKYSDNVEEWVRSYKHRPFKFTTFRDSLSLYPGVNTESLKKTFEMWSGLFDKYCTHRIAVKKYEEEKSVKNALKKLQDYIFLYLTAWNLIHGIDIYPVPASPKYFRRNYFSRIIRDSEAPSPLTFYEFLALTSKEESTAGCIYKVNKFFEFIEKEFRVDEEVAGHMFVNPINIEFDLPKTFRRFTTANVSLPRESVPYFLEYIKGVEIFGMHLQALLKSRHENLLEDIQSSKKIEKNVNSPLHESILLSKSFLLAGDYDFQHSIQIHDGQNLKFEKIPNVFTWKNVQYKNGNKYLTPLLGNLRAIACCIETGLRSSSIRWLDKNTWNNSNIQTVTDPEDKVFPLYINTDKAKSQPFVRWYPIRLKWLIQREIEFWNEVSFQNEEKAFPYNEREHSRFNPVIPVFKSYPIGNPINYSGLARAWKFLLAGFQEYCHANLNRDYQLVYYSDSDGMAKPIDCSKPIKKTLLETPHTLHSTRVTYITSRVGHVPIGDISYQVGHKNISTTQYYVSSNPIDLVEKSKSLDLAFHKQMELLSAGADAYVRADIKGSQLMRCLAADKEKTIDTFGFMPSIALWSGDECGSDSIDAMELLRNTPISRMAHFNTHICPVGSHCPEDVVKQLGGFKKCGACPYAMKCVDHLPAISAKKNELIEQIRILNIKKESLLRREELTQADRVYEEVASLATEYSGWELSEKILIKKLRELPQNSSKDFYVFEPEMVKRHIQSVHLNLSEAEFYLTRIFEANAYPEMISVEVQRRAKQLSLDFLSGTNLSKYKSQIDDDPLRFLVNQCALILESQKHLSATEKKANVLSIEGNSGDE